MLAALLYSLFEFGDPVGYASPKRGGSVLGLEVRDLPIDALLKIRDLRRELLESLDCNVKPSARELYLRHPFGLTPVRDRPGRG